VPTPSSTATTPTRPAPPWQRCWGPDRVNAGGGWLIFALPPAELAVHPAKQGGRAELYLMTDDVAGTVTALQAEGIEVTRPISDQGWGLLTAITLLRLVK
jgi:hypothetical protein